MFKFIMDLLELRLSWYYKSYMLELWQNHGTTI